MLKTIALVLLLLCPQWTIPLHVPALSGGPPCTTPPTANMLAGYFIDNASGCTSGGASISTIPDVSGNSNTLTAASGITCTSGVINGHSALTFGATLVTPASAINCEATCSVYAVAEQTVSTDPVLFGANTSANVYALQVVTSGASKMEVDQQGVVPIATSTSTLPLNTWLRIAFSCSGPGGTGTYTCTLYHDGASVGSSSASATINAGISSIGVTQPGNFSGKLVALYFYSAAYSAATDACVANQTGVNT